MRRACCILASVLAACSDPEAAPKAPPAAAQAYFQDYVVHDKAPGFRLENQIEPTRADPKRFFWRATYDREGRIVAAAAHQAKGRLTFRTDVGRAERPHRRAGRIILCKDGFGQSNVGGSLVWLIGPDKGDRV